MGGENKSTVMNCDNSSTPEWVGNWFSDPEYGNDLQDMDFVLADVALLPQLSGYLDDPGGTETKKGVVILALLNLLEEINMEGENREVSNEIVSIVKRHANIAEGAMKDFGPITKTMVRRILGKEIPKDMPSWVVDLADGNLQFRHLP